MNTPHTSLGELILDPDRVRLVERDLAVVQHRLAQMERRHETVPNRITKLEQRFEHMSTQLSQLNKGQQQLTSVVSGIGRKISWAMAVAGTLWAILQMIVPVVLKVVLP
jgi:septal ring factor EnvC (AmiA/AmiB activator)